MADKWNAFKRCLLRVAASLLCLTVWTGKGESEQMSASAANNIPVRIEIILPTKMPDDDIFLAGNILAAGSWKADGLKCERIHDTMAAVSLFVPSDTALEFKITRGSWETVEKGSAYEEIANRRIVVSDTILELDVPIVQTRIKVAAWADSAPKAPPTYSGTVRRHNLFESKILGNSRVLLVYLPPDYDSTDARYPTLYVHDGQNVFDAVTSFTGVEWGIDERCEELIRAGAIEPVIVVGVYNMGGDRISEYTPVADAKRGGGRGDAYARFLIEEVKPFIDRTYRTAPDRGRTAVMGSSLGGLISLHLAWAHGDVFGKAAAVSPSLWWANREIVARIDSTDTASPPEKLWIDMGTEEGIYPSKYMEDFKRMGGILESRGIKPPDHLAVRIYEGADHSERAWAARVGDILKFLFGR